MTFKSTQLTRLALVAVMSMLATACVVVPPIYSGNTDENGDTSKQSTQSGTSQAVCTIEGKKTQDISDGTTKASITQSCEETVVYIENTNENHPKRCRVLTGTNLTEMYIKPGDSRTLTQPGLILINGIRVSCINDWNRTK